MITSSHLVILGALGIVWSGGIWASVEAIKASARAAGVSGHRAFVRALPVMPSVLGATTGALGAARWVLVLAGIEPPEIPWSGVGAFVGVGAGAVSGQAFKVWRQAVRAVDGRLDPPRE